MQSVKLPLTGRQKIMESVIPLTPIIDGIPIPVKNLDLAASTNTVFNTEHQKVLNTIASSNEVPPEKVVTPEKGVPSKNEESDQLKLSRIESNERGINIPDIEPSSEIKNWNLYICDRILYGVFKVLWANPENVTNQTDLILQIKHDLIFFKKRIVQLLKDTKKIKGQEENINKEVKKQVDIIAYYFKCMHMARNTLCDKISKLIQLYDTRDFVKIRTEILYKMSLPPILNIVNQMMYDAKDIVEKFDKENILVKDNPDMNSMLKVVKEQLLVKVDTDIQAMLNGVKDKVFVALRMKTQYFVDKLFPQEHVAKERYTSLETASYGDQETFFEIVNLKIGVLPIPHDKESLKNFLILVLCLYIRLEGKVPDVNLEDYTLDNFNPQKMEDGKTEDYPSLLLQLFKKS
jgi:hypothetical protein